MRRLISLTMFTQFLVVVISLLGVFTSFGLAWILVLMLSAVSLISSWLTQDYYQYKNAPSSARGHARYRGSILSPKVQAYIPNLLGDNGSELEEEPSWDSDELFDFIDDDVELDFGFGIGDGEMGFLEEDVPEWLIDLDESEGLLNHVSDSEMGNREEDTPEWLADLDEPVDQELIGDEPYKNYNYAPLTWLGYPENLLDSDPPESLAETTELAEFPAWSDVDDDQTEELNDLPDFIQDEEDPEEFGFSPLEAESDPSLDELSDREASEN